MFAPRTELTDETLSFPIMGKLRPENKNTDPTAAAFFALGLQAIIGGFKTTGAEVPSLIRFGAGLAFVPSAPGARGEGKSTWEFNLPQQSHRVGTLRLGEKMGEKERRRKTRGGAFLTMSH